MKYIIKEVLDNDTQERSKQWGYRVGRICEIHDTCQVGKVLIVLYENGSYFTTSVITAMEELDYQLKVVTLNRTYIFQKKKSKIITNKIRCKRCNDIVESVQIHDFKRCSCGLVAVDGGKDYLRRCYGTKSWEEAFEDLSIIE